VNPTDSAGKVTASRLRRDAYLYIRQSTLYQVANNTESTTRQYDLRGRAAALGWPVVERPGAHLDIVNDEEAIADILIGLA